jgi:hypothetical protein
MSRSALFIFLFVICASFGSVYADVPPDPGYVRQSVSLTLETIYDLADYRFFIESPMRIEEIAIKKGELTVVSADGRVGSERVGTLWAIPRTTIGEDFGVSAPEKLEGMREALKEGRMYRALKLLSHDFQTTIREIERVNWKDPVYRLDKNTGQGVTAVLISGGVQENKSNSNKGLYSTEPKTTAFWAAVAGGMILTLSFISFGAWALRRSRLKAIENGS